MTIGIAGAFLGGVLALLSPCSALLLPAFFAYAFGSKRQLVARTFVFFVGLSIVMIPLGAAAGSFGSLLAEHRGTLIMAGGVLMILIGIYTFLGFGFSIPGLSKLSGSVNASGWLGQFLLGAVYGFAGFCAGPLLGAVLTTAMVSVSSIYGAVVLGAYALGMTVPLFILALLWEQFDLGNKQLLRGKTWMLGPIKLNTFSMAAGILFILIGILFLTTYGTSDLPGLISTDTQFQIQEKVAELSSHITNAQVLLWIAIVVAVILFSKVREQDKRAALAEQADEVDEEADEEADDEVADEATVPNP